ncbi:MAG: hypothetical protein IPK58_26085 [Acidobacteria bacterium]|nr:hypothetical protein [Acidobacteriota bacterium]
MSQFTVDLEEKENETVETVETAVPRDEKPAGPSRFGWIVRGILIFLAVAILVSTVSGYVYWQRVKASPQYSLALLVEAARQDDQKQMDDLVDTDSVVDSFLPQVIEKAVELYGKNLPEAVVSRLTIAADQFKPAIKRRAREEVPRVIREKTDKFERVPYWAIAVGAGWFLDIKTEGETAKVKSLIENRPFELTMKKNGNVWRVVAIKDEVVARRIAEKIGQELVALASKEGLNKAAEKLGVKSVDDIKKKIDDIFK